MQSVGTFPLSNESALSRRLWAHLAEMNQVDWNGALLSEILPINAFLLQQNSLTPLSPLHISNEAYQLPL